MQFGTKMSETLPENRKHELFIINRVRVSRSGQHPPTQT